MLYVFLGPDTQKARAALHKKLGKEASVRVTDAHAVPDLESVLKGAQGSLFGEPRSVVLDSVLEREELAQMLRAALPGIAASTDSFYLFAAQPDAATKKLLEKYAEEVQKFDLPKKGKSGDFFALAGALQKGKKKDLWVLLQAEFAAGKAAEAVHGSLFWAAKQLCLRDSSARARRLVAELAELPHEARRKGVELEYALERFALSRV